MMPRRPSSAQVGMIAGGSPELGPRLLVRAWPDVDVGVGEELALPTERAVMGGQGFLDQVDGFPLALADAHRVGVAGGHFCRAGFDEANIEPAARQHIDRRVFRGDADRVGADGDQRTEREDADLFGQAGDDAGDDRDSRPKGC